MNSTPVNFSNLYALISCVDNLSDRGELIGLSESDKDRSVRYEMSALINLAFELEYISGKVDQRLQFLEEKTAE